MVADSGFVLVTFRQYPDNWENLMDSLVTSGTAKPTGEPLC